MEREYPGKLIVIDGTDGSGKTVQTKMLLDELESYGYDVAMADFPQYEKKSAGLVEEYLNGKYGNANDVGPYRASIFYACDRYDASFKIREWLKKGKIVIANRYVTANMGHQGGKISDPIERKNFFNWVCDLEYNIFDIPKPDLNIILHVRADISQKLVDQKGERNYLNGAKRDIHETDLKHLQNAERVYLEIANSFPNFKLIECVCGDQIIRKEEIHTMVWNEVRLLLNQNYFSPIWNRSLSEAPHNLPLQNTEEKKNSDLILCSSDFYSLYPGDSAIISTGIKLSIRPDVKGLILGDYALTKNNIQIASSIIDSSCVDEIKIAVTNYSGDIFNISPGQNIGRIAFIN